MLQKDILSKILVDTNIQLLKGFKSVLEELIILSIWTSAIFKMNIQSFIDVSLVLLFFIRRSQSMMKFILTINAIVFFIRLGTVLSNMDRELVSPMQYPEIFLDVGTDYLVPWVKRIYDNSDDKTTI